MVESKQQWKAWLYLAPAIVLLLVFTVWPIINTVAMAFMEDYSGLAKIGGETAFGFGVGNFVKVAENAEFQQALTNTILLCLITVPVSTILALLIAVALNAIKPLQKVLRGCSCKLVPQRIYSECNSDAAGCRSENQHPLRSRQKQY